MADAGGNAPDEGQEAKSPPVDVPQAAKRSSSFTFGSPFGISPKTKGRFGELFKSATQTASQFADKSKKSLKLAANELQSQFKELQQQGRDVKEGVSTKTAKIKESDNLKIFARGGQIATRVRTAAAGALDGGVYGGPMDRESEAGYALVYHYSDSLAQIHARTQRNIKAAHATSAVIEARQAQCKKFASKAVSFQAELAGLPNSMSVVSGAIATVCNLRDGIHAVEAELGKLEILVEEVELNRLKARQPMIIEEYQRATDATILRHRRLAEAEYRKARKEASKSALKMAEERQAALAKVFKEQMEEVRKQEREHAKAQFPWATTSPSPQLSPATKRRLSAVDLKQSGASAAALEEFLAGVGPPPATGAGSSGELHSPTLSMASLPQSERDADELEKFLGDEPPAAAGGGGGDGAASGGAPESAAPDDADRVPQVLGDEGGDSSPDVDKEQPQILGDEEPDGS